MMADFWIILGLVVFVLQPVSPLWTKPINTCSPTTRPERVHQPWETWFIHRSFCWTCVRLLFGHLWIQCFFKYVPQCLLVSLGWKNYKGKRRKRVSTGGIRKRLRRRGCRLPLPAIILSNVRSLRNKLDELSALIRYDEDYRSTRLFCFAKTWLSQETEDFHLDGFTLIRFDRDILKTQKTVGGGLCMAVNNRWALNFTLRETKCSKHYEIMVVSFCPHYLPW